MKIKEVTEPSDAALFEQLDAENTTGISTEDLVKVVRQERDGTWSQPMTAEELMDHLRKLANGG